ncbi:MAG TPA: adenosylmethionine--8-amino-7-oxononanoate transaminase [Stellaceae bacterium]|nr:adenosylmethionine--8-amino-7-oxononanoate transaminase [Stellaceae bacterium]
MSRAGTPVRSTPLAGLDHLWLPYAQMRTAPAPLPVARTEGCKIHLADGRVLIDGIASWWTACHGYNHPHIRNAIARQLETVPHVMMAGLVHEPAVRLAQRLAALLPGDLNHVFFSDSGSVAVEIALKMAIQFYLNCGQAGRDRFVAFADGYHGDTFAAMAVSDGRTGMHGRFGAAARRHFVRELPRDDAGESTLDRFLADHRSELAGIVVEPLVQGAGGMVFHSAEVLRRLRQLADRHDLLLIFDEIFTGFGRTGRLFAIQEAGVVPDIVTLSKALTGGTLPLAATVARKRVYEGFLSDDPQDALMHGPTFMGNALACAAANASLDLFEREPRLEQAAAIGRQMDEELAPCRGARGVRDVRVKGAIGVVELDSPEAARALRDRFVSEGTWIRPFGCVVYLTPAFTIMPDELSLLTGAIRRAVTGVR